MFQIKYNNIFFDLVPNQTCEIERNSPLFLVDNNLAEYSTPVALAYSDNNSKAIGHYFFDTTVKTKISIAVEVYYKGTFRYNATMIIESAGMNFTYKGAGTASGYLLIGISNFFVQVKDKLLTDLILDGDRVFEHTTDDPLDASDGYWQHFQDTYNFMHDYVMLPCKNDAFSDDDIEFSFTNGWMNKFDGEKIVTGQPVVPWVKLEYVLHKIFEENGWTLDTSAITDTEWKKLLLYSNYTISTTYYGWDGEAVTTLAIPEITINLANAMPAGITCSKFVFEICKRYLWAPVCDTGKNICKLIALKDIGNTPPVEYTKYASVASTSEFSVEEKIFAFKNNYVGEDQYPSSADLTQYPTPIPAYSKNTLPSLEFGNYDNLLYYTWLENKFWTPYWDSTEHINQWLPYADNIYDEAPENATDTFETDVGSFPIELALLENGHYAAVPVVDQAKKTDWGIRTIIYHGMQHQVDGYDSPLEVTYPCGISTNMPPGGTPLLAWSNVYKHTTYTNEYGIIEYWAKKWLEIISPVEEITQRFYLPLYMLLNFKWEKIILIRNIPYLIKSFTEPLNYAGFIEAKLQKVKLTAHAPVVGDEQEDVHFTDNPTLFGDTYNYVALQYLKGPAGAVVTIEFTTLTKSDISNTVKINDYEYYSTGETFTVTLDSEGNAVFNVKLAIVHSSPEAIFVVLTITATDTGALGTPLTAGYDKVNG